MCVSVWACVCMCVGEENREFRSWGTAAATATSGCQVPGGYLRDDVLRLCDCVCAVLCSICVIANALYARKMIAILPPRGTYAAMTVRGGWWWERREREIHTFYPGRVHRRKSPTFFPVLPLPHILPTAHAPASPQKARARTLYIYMCACVCVYYENLE